MRNLSMRIRAGCIVGLALGGPAAAAILYILHKEDKK